MPTQAQRMTALEASLATIAEQLGANTRTAEAGNKREARTMTAKRATRKAVAPPRIEVRFAEWVDDPGTRVEIAFDADASSQGKWNSVGMSVARADTMLEHWDEIGKQMRALLKA